MSLFAIATHAGVAALSYIPVKYAPAKFGNISPIVTIALTVLCGCLVQGVKKINLGEKNDLECSFIAMSYGLAKIELVKTMVALLAFPILGVSRGLATVGAIFIASNTANCIASYASYKPYKHEGKS